MATPKNNNTKLNDMMDKEPRHSGIAIDLTKPIESVPTNETPEVEQKAEAPVRASVVQTAPVDMSAMESINSFDILPKREAEMSSVESDLFAKLDAAVDKECESITKRVDELTAAQKEEYETRKKEEEELKQAEEDNFALNGTPADDADEDYGDDEYTNTSAILPNENVTRVQVNTDDAEEDSADEDVSESDAPEEDITKGMPGPNVDDTVKEDEAVETVAEEVEAPAPVLETRTEPTILDNIEDDMLFKDTDEIDDEEDAVFENLKTEVKSKLAPIRKSFDLSKFTIAQKSMNAQKVMKLAVNSHQTVADWVLYAAERPISFTGLSGPEILKLNPESSNRNRLNTFRDMYRVMYDHLYDGNKPEFETWLKQTRFVDIQHIYFGLYMATFAGSNFITYNCTNPKCNHVFIKDISFEDMIEYANDDVKKKVKGILKMDTTSPSNDSYPVDLEQISNKYVFGLKHPSIWNVIMETASLSDAFIEKYSDLIDIVSYIDTIYYIDEENNQLVPVDTKPDPNDQAKTSARKIKAFYDIIRTLSSEDYYALRAKISDYDKVVQDILYKIPACTCPKCATEIPVNKEITPDNLLFTRHQLAAIGNM